MKFTAANISVIKLTHFFRSGFGLWLVFVGYLFICPASLQAQVDTTLQAPPDTTKAPLPDRRPRFNPGKRLPTERMDSIMEAEQRAAEMQDSLMEVFALPDSLATLALSDSSTLDSTVSKKKRKKLIRFNFIRYYVKDDKPRMEIKLPWRTVDYPSVWAFSPERSPPYNPKVASSRAMLIPGWGQYYNRSYWKLPIVYGGLGFFAYLFDYNNGQYQVLRQAYIFRTDEDPTTVDNRFSENIPDSGILSARDQARRNRDFSVIVAGGWWALSIVEAFVDAHLKGFDVSEDLSIRVKMKPSRIDGLPGGGSAFGAGFTVEF